MKSIENVLNVLGLVVESNQIALGLAVVPDSNDIGFGENVKPKNIGLAAELGLIALGFLASQTPYPWV